MRKIKNTFSFIYSFCRIFISKIVRINELSKFSVLWALQNPKNKTYPVNYFNISLVDIGDYSYGPINIYSYANDKEGLQIGKYCSIAKDVKFILGGNHRFDCIMTYPIRTKFISSKINESFCKGKIILEDDVWIGVGATLLSGVRIGQGSVIAAGAVVTKSFPPFSVIGGNPAKIIKMRFEEKIIRKIEKFDLVIGSIDPSKIKENIKHFDLPSDDESLKIIINSVK